MHTLAPRRGDAVLVQYICKECGLQLATAHADGSHDARLGLHELTPSERSRVLSRQGDILRVHTYCDACADPRQGGQGTGPLLH